MLTLNPLTGQWEEVPTPMASPQQAGPAATAIALPQQPLLGPDPARDALLQALAGRYSVPPNRIATQGSFKSDAMSGEEWAKTFGSGGPSNVRMTDQQQAGVKQTANVNRPDAQAAGAVAASPAAYTPDQNPQPLNLPDQTTNYGQDEQHLARNLAMMQPGGLGQFLAGMPSSGGGGRSTAGTPMATIQGFTDAATGPKPAAPQTSAPVASPVPTSLPNHNPANPAAPTSLGQALSILPGGAPATAQPAPVNTLQDTINVARQQMLQAEVLRKKKAADIAAAAAQNLTAPIPPTYGFN